MPLRAAEAEQRQSAAWLKGLLGSELPAKVERAIDWQLWCWGRDVADIPGNGLLRMQFERVPPPPGIKSSSCYCHTHWQAGSMQHRLALRGCGVFYGQSESVGIAVPRSRFSPCLQRCEQYPPMNWAVDRTLVIRAAQSDAEKQVVLTLAIGLFERIATYEQMARSLFGKEHRQNCRQKWHKPVPVNVNDPTASWQEFADAVRHRLDHQIEGSAFSGVVGEP